MSSPKTVARWSTSRIVAFFASRYMSMTVFIVGEHGPQFRLPEQMGVKPIQKPVEFDVERLFEPAKGCDRAFIYFQEA
jgi:hypothetical protein